MKSNVSGNGESNFPKMEAFIEQSYLKSANQIIKFLLPNLKGSVSDGYHTFEELYEHRSELWITICRLIRDVGFLGETLAEINNRIYTKEVVWRSRKHSDGESYKGWFLLGIGINEGEQITYHLPDKYWGRCSFAITREEAPEFDGHTSADVIERLKML